MKSVSKRFVEIHPKECETTGRVTGRLEKCNLEEPLLHLVKLRISQINNCAICRDLHRNNLRTFGEGEYRLSLVDAWRECPQFSARERAAFRWAESIATAREGFLLPDAILQEALIHFSENELCSLTAAINCESDQNQLCMSFCMFPGGCK